MKKSVYLETSIPSYLTARLSRDVRALAWQQITTEWWDTARKDYNVFISELVIVEASSGNPDAAERRLAALHEIPELRIDEEANHSIRLHWRWVSIPGDLHPNGAASGER